MIFLVIPYFAILSRMSGGGLSAHYLDTRDNGGVMPLKMTGLPEWVMAFSVAFLCLDGAVPVLLGTIASFLGINAGTGVWYTMGRNPNYAKTRDATLEKLVLPICKLFDWEEGGKQYSWLFGGIKGFIAGLPAFPFNIPLILMYPAAYELGWQCRERFGVKAPTAIGEWVSGAFIGIVVVFYLWGSA